MATNTLPASEYGIDKAHRRVIFASSLGTVFSGMTFICTAHWPRSSPSSSSPVSMKPPGSSSRFWRLPPASP